MNYTPIRFLVKKAEFKIISVECPFHHFPRIIRKFLNVTKLGGEIWLVAEK